jgi:cyclopropane-fatty-acyl-phospholipid synthase
MLLAAMLGKVIRCGRLAIRDADGRIYEVGDESPVTVVMRLHDKAVARELLLNPQMAFGEAYMDGRLTFEKGDVGDFLDLAARNLGTGYGPAHWQWIASVRRWTNRLGKLNTLRRAHRNVAHHYDLSGALYDLFLDRDKQYSCAFFESPSDTLEEAQLRKKQRIAAKLDLKPGQRVLDIGSGWGGLALHLAQAENVEVVGVTLSEEQLKVANARAAEMGLSERVRFYLQDYRNVSGRFDRIVSVGMFEHVGVNHYRQYFEDLASLLADDGVALVHSIGRSDGPGATNSWAAKYIFPGAYAPALSEVLPVIERTGLIVSDIEILRLHYAYTLAQWRKRFRENRAKVARLYDERFCRMWEFYLAGAEIGFRYQGMMVFQVQLVKRVDALPLTRDYMIPEVDRPQIAAAIPKRQRISAAE